MSRPPHENARLAAGQEEQCKVLMTAAGAEPILSAGNDLPSVGVVLPAGGKGLRAGTLEPKQFQSLQGKLLLEYTLETFSRLAFVKSIALVLPAERLEAASSLPTRYPKVKLVAGGSERWESVRDGYHALDPELPFVLVHDVARPFVSEGIIRRCMEAVALNVSPGLTGGTCAIAALPMTDTIKEISQDMVTRTLDRRNLIQVQTPQIFPRSVLAAVYAQVANRNSETKNPLSSLPTDEAVMAEQAGYPVRWVRGSDFNRKITGAADLAWAMWMAERLQAGETLPDV